MKNKKTRYIRERQVESLTLPSPLKGEDKGEGDRGFSRGESP